MANIAIQDILASGAAPSFVAAAGGGDSFDYDPNGFIEVRNAGGSPINATVVVPGSFLGQAIPDVVQSVPATTGNVKFKMHPSMINPATGKVDVTYSGVTSVTVAALRAPAA